MKINVVSVKSVMESNNVIAEKNRQAFKKSGIFAINIISSPGSGKTTLLEKTIPALSPTHKAIVVVGDLQTTRDAQRVVDCALQVTQINTGMSCHLYANQVAKSLDDLQLEKADFLFIENVGNMVCPGEFDLGENAKVILYSIPEGDDKVAKYPTIFRVADLVLLTKIDLLGVLDFDISKVRRDIAKLNSNVEVLEFSSKTGRGMQRWLDWLTNQRKQHVGRKANFVEE